MTSQTPEHRGRGRPTLVAELEAFLDRLTSLTALARARARAGTPETLGTGDRGSSHSRAGALGNPRPARRRGDPFVPSDVPAPRADLEGWGWFWREDVATPLLDAHCEAITRALEGGPLTVAQLVRATGIPENSVRHVLYGRWRHAQRFRYHPGWPHRWGLVPSMTPRSGG